MHFNLSFLKKTYLELIYFFFTNIIFMAYKEYQEDLNICTHSNHIY